MMDADFFDATQALPLDELSDVEEEPASGQRRLVAHLKVICQKGNPESLIPVYEGQNIVGRSEKCDLHIPVKALSKEHAVIEVRGDDHLIFDKGSRNRSRRGKLFLSPDVRYELRDGDKLTFADVQCIYNRVVVPPARQENEDAGSETGSETGSESMLNTQEVNAASARDVESTLVYNDDAEEADEDVSEPSSDILQPTQAFCPDGSGPIPVSRLAAVQDTLTFADASDEEEEAAVEPFTAPSTLVLDTPVAHPFAKGKVRGVAETPASGGAPDTPNTSFIPETQVFEESDDEGADTVIPATQDFGADHATQLFSSDVGTPQKEAKSGDFAATQAYSMDVESTVDANAIRASRKSSSRPDATVAYDMDMESTQTAEEIRAARQAKTNVTREGGETVAYDMDIESTQTADEIRAARGKKKQRTEAATNISASQAPTECFPSDDEEEEVDDVPSNVRTCSTLAFELDDDVEEEIGVQEQNNNKKGVPLDEEATQAFGDQEATQVFEEETGKVSVGSDGATLSMGDDDATQVVQDADDDATQAVVTEDATLAVDDTVAVDGAIVAGDTQVFEAEDVETKTDIAENDAPTQIFTDGGATQIIEEDTDTQTFSDTESSQSRSRARKPRISDEAATQLVGGDMEPTLCVDVDDITVPGAGRRPAGGGAAEEATQFVAGGETQVVYESDEEQEADSRPRPRHSVMFAEATQLIADPDATQVFNEEESDDEVPTLDVNATPFAPKPGADDATPSVSELDETQVVDDESTPLFSVTKTPVVINQKKKEESASPALSTSGADLDATQIVDGDSCQTLAVEETSDRSSDEARQQDMAEIATVPIDDDGFAKPFPMKKLRLSKAFQEEDSEEAETQDFSEGLPDLDEEEEIGDAGKLAGEDADLQATQAYAEEGEEEEDDDDDDETQPMSEPLLEEEAGTSEVDGVRPAADDAATQAYGEDETQALSSPTKHIPNSDDAETQAFQEEEKQADTLPAKRSQLPDEAETQAYDEVETQAASSPVKRIPDSDDAETQAFQEEETQAATSPAKQMQRLDEVETQAYEEDETQAATLSVKSGPPLLKHKDDVATQAYSDDEAAPELEPAPVRKGRGRTSKVADSSAAAGAVTSVKKTSARGRRGKAAVETSEEAEPDIAATPAVASASTAVAGRSRNSSPHEKKVTFDVSSSEEEPVVEPKSKRSARGQPKSKAAAGSSAKNVKTSKSGDKKKVEADEAESGVSGQDASAVASDATTTNEPVTETNQRRGRAKTKVAEATVVEIDEEGSSKRGKRQAAKAGTKSKPAGGSVVKEAEPEVTDDVSEVVKESSSKRGKQVRKAAVETESSRAVETKAAEPSRSGRGRAGRAATESAGGSKTNEAQPKEAEGVPEVTEEVRSSKRGVRAGRGASKSASGESQTDSQTERSSQRRGRKAANDVPNEEAVDATDAAATTSRRTARAKAAGSEPADTQKKPESADTKSAPEPATRQSRRGQIKKEADANQDDENVAEVETGRRGKSKRSASKPAESKNHMAAELSNDTKADPPKTGSRRTRASDVSPADSESSSSRSRTRGSSQASDVADKDKDGGEIDSKTVSTRHRVGKASEAGADTKPPVSKRSAAGTTRSKRGADSAVPEEVPKSEPASRGRSSRGKVVKDEPIDDDVASVTSTEGSQSSRRSKRSASPVDEPATSRRSNRGAASKDQPTQQDSSDTTTTTRRGRQTKPPVVKVEPESPPPAPRQRGKRGAAAAELEEVSSEQPTKTSRRTGKAATVTVKQEPAEVPSSQESTSSRGGRKRKTDESAPSQKSPKKVSPHFEDVSTPERRGSIPVKFEHTPILRRRTIERKPRVMFTGLVDEEGQKTVKDLGGELVESVYDCTHLVTDKVRRTVKFLCGMARGILIVSPTWLARCRDSRTFIDAGAFVLKDVANEASFNFSMSKTLDSAAEQPLLDGFKVHVTKNVRPDPAQMKDIITCAGGEILTAMPKKSEDSVIVISCEEDKALCKSAISSKIPVVGAEFLLTGILRHAREFDLHRLFEKPAPAAAAGTSAGSKRQAAAAAPSREPSKRKRR